MKILNVVLFLVIVSILPAQLLPDNIDISGSENGVIPIPEDIDSFWVNNFSLYTKYITPNDGSIHIIGQSQISVEQMIQVRNILSHYLADYPNSEYGDDKSALANRMANNNAQMIIYNGHDGEFNVPEAYGQWLFEDEIVVDGSSWYIDTSVSMLEEHRDATFEEVLHMVHDFGIGVDGANSLPGVLPDYQSEIRAAQINALDNNTWGMGEEDWIEELAEENSLSQEYFASVVDSYYGLWAAYTQFNGGMWGLYIAKSRSELLTLDPMGAEIMNQKLFAPYLQYTSLLSSEFDGTFYMQFDENIPYTHKSQYLINVHLSGSLNSNLSGNSQDNILKGNSGDNTIDGLGGEDIIEFQGNFQEYTIQTNGNEVSVSDQIENRDGNDIIINAEFLKFMDQVITISDLNIHDNLLIWNYQLSHSPNPFNPVTKIQYDIPDQSQITLKILDVNGRLISELENKITAGGQYQTLWNGRDYNGKQVASGIYFYRLTVISSQTEKAFTQSNKMLLLK